MVNQPVRQHFVPRFFLKHFAQEKKGQHIVRLYDKFAHKSGKDVSVKNAFLKNDYYTLTDDDGKHYEVEKELAEKEGMFSDAVRRVHCDLSLYRIEDYKLHIGLIANLIARSPSMRVYFEFVNRTVLELDRKDPHQLNEYSDIFVGEENREPTPRELFSTIKQAEELYHLTNHPNILSLTEFYHHLIAVFCRSGYVFYKPKDQNTGFCCGDSPVLVANNKYNKVGVREMFAFGSFDYIFLPLGRHLAIKLEPILPRPTEQNEVVCLEMETDEVKRINYKIWYSSCRFVASHPLESPRNFIPEYNEWLEYKDNNSSENKAWSTELWGLPEETLSPEAKRAIRETLEKAENRISL